eukprot:comp17478_c0_seq1/m.16967 comp17478_c0_seq1/g.16967  ORF comp17478_c0_seq1/g.16967 comp17478_c0_seq1/m.16967 type:complete len:258 (-) comp17478_c0_seq1:487-1260(-)
MSFFNQLLDGANKLNEATGGVAGTFVEQATGQMMQTPQAQALMNDLGVDKIAAGLKEALKIGIQTAVQMIGKENGFLMNQAVKIGVPPKVQPILEAAKQVPGANVVVDKVSSEFESSMNHAAEKAVPLGLDVFFDALGAMQFEDVKNIWKGNDNRAATEFFERTCTPKLKDAFGPIIREEVAKNHVTHYYDSLMDNILKLPVVKNIPFLESMIRVDVDEYTLEHGLKGLFLMIGEQEEKIRTDPKYRTTDLLQQVFK